MAPHLLTCLVALSSGRLDDKNIEAHDEAAFEQNGDDRSMRVHAFASAGLVGVGRGSRTDYGPLLAVGVPFYLGRRNAHTQLVMDTHISVALGLKNDRLTFVATPTVGLNYYLFGWLGFEFRLGVGLGVRWNTQVAAAGFGYAMEAAVVVRPFERDDIRLKLGAVGQQLMVFSNVNTTSLSLAGGLGFETKI